jgi:hypothetical protein
MATDYDAPRKADDDTESIEAIKERVPATTGASDTEVDDSGDSFSIPDVVSEDLEVVVLPPGQIAAPWPCTVRTTLPKNQPAPVIPYPP